MRLAWEFDWPGSRIEPSITSLAWTGDAERGELATGSESGVVGITLTHFSAPSHSDTARHNFNLRGHHSAVSCVTWNRAKGKLASSDQSGVIYVWARNEERWSVELVNERGVKVRDVSWSPCGNAALICYEDNFVLIGSASGQRIWSYNYPSNQTVACGVWLSAQMMVIAFVNGSLHLLSNDGMNLAERKMCTDEEVTDIISPLNGERFAILMKNGLVYVLLSFDQDEPYVFEDVGVSLLQWTSDGKFLAAVTPYGEIYILDDHARLIHRDCIHVPCGRKVTALTWAHDGRVLIVAVGGNIHVARVYPRVPSLYRILSYKVWKLIGGDASKIDNLSIPTAEKDTIKEYDHHIIRCGIPPIVDLHHFVSSLSDSRCYCTIKWNSTGGRSFSLCIEHMGGLVPILTGRLTSRFRPHFDISIHPWMSHSSFGNTRPLPLVCGPFSQVEDTGCAPLLPSSLTRHTSVPQRLSLWRRSTRRLRTLISRRVIRPIDLTLAQVSSNLCCTKFKVTSTIENAPTIIANVSYKTSVLHLQPRQMTVKLVDIEDNGERKLELWKTVAGECCAMREAILAAEMKGITKKWEMELEEMSFIDQPEGSNEKEELLKGLEGDGESEERGPVSTVDSDERGKVGLDELREDLKDLQRRVEEIEKRAARSDVRKELRHVSKSLKKVKAALSDGKSDRRIFTLHNKTPFWNEHNQVYQLDFGGRVTQESAKNFQIEFDGTQSLQFGRIEGGAYTLDFRRPFTPIQAFSIALASITQRLK
ncbi:hypothetical protein PFISCL1PPCAC_19978 [Pristionchus fissidentatus]|uniref:Tub-2 n=1 Tax=Pristionchus fissidentatus TaxID=1538716 RepID=A0AAV5W8X2_9BILA|nr:hypothetical protein PFISCL1PPCAC_19978 [Pristionchus fissidentatus]